MKIKRVGVRSVGTTIFFLFLVFGLIYAIRFLLLLYTGGELSEVGLTTAGAIAFLLLFPIASGIVGFIIGIIAATAYNMSVKLTGGIKIETSEN